MNKIGIYFAYWTRNWDADFGYYLDKVAGLGFDILEVASGHMLEISFDQRMELKKRAADRGVEITYCIGFPPEMDMASEDSLVRNRGIDYAKHTLEVIHSMGGKVFGGINYSCWPAMLPQGVEDKRPYLERSIGSMRKVIGTAEDFGIDYCIEIVNRFEQYLLNTASEGLAFCEAVGSPNIKLLLDAFHMNIEEDSIEDAIVRSGKRLGHLHIGETNRKPPGQGRMPWGEIASALKKIDYEGRIVMEPFVSMGGQVGRDIRVWRDIGEGADEETLDRDAREALRFTRKEIAWTGSR